MTTTQKELTLSQLKIRAIEKHLKLMEKAKRVMSQDKSSETTNT